MKMNREEQYLWVEKYRPDTLDGYIGNDHFVTKLKSWIADNDIPHMLLYGPAGTGKTTAAQIITNNIDCDVLFINASDENSVDTIRNKLRGFAQGIGFSNLNVAVLDEADFVTPQGQAALRNLMETFSESCRFILTANYLERIIAPIQSRCHVFEIITPSRKDAAIHVAGILKKENVDFSLTDLKLLVDSHYPDLRQIINDAQNHTIDGKLQVEARQIAESDYKSSVFQIMTGKGTSKEKFQQVRQAIADAKIRDYTPMYRLLFDRVDDICPNNISACILAIAEGQSSDALVMDHEINMMATLVNVLRLQ